jgi:hypothetical protein
MGVLSAAARMDRGVLERNICSCLVVNNNKTEFSIIYSFSTTRYKGTSLSKDHLIHVFGNIVRQGVYSLADGNDFSSLTSLMSDPIPLSNHAVIVSPSLR